MKLFTFLSLFLTLIPPCFSHSLPQTFVLLADIDPSIHQNIIFATDNNCFGTRLNGYEAQKAIVTLDLAKKLSVTQADLKKQNPNYSLLILDAYRPVRAVEHIKKWAADLSDQETKQQCYPDIDKKDLPGKYIAAGSSSHSRGSTVDIIILNTKTQIPLDFGPMYFGEAAGIGYSKLTKEQKANRLMLRKIMLVHGFKPYDAEYWHFTLRNEPYPHTFFNFPIK